MPRELEEFLRDGNVVVGGDVLNEADIRDAAGNIVDLPDEREFPSIAVKSPAETPAATTEQADELTPLERAQKEWDDRFDEFDNNAPSTDIARERMVSKYGPRPEALEDVNLVAVLADKAVTHAAVDSFKQAALQRRLDEVDANPRLRPEEKESEKLLIRARHKAQEDIRRRELDRH